MLEAYFVGAEPVVAALAGFSALLLTYMLLRSLRIRPLPDVPVAYPPTYTSVPWFIGFGLAIAKVTRTGNVPTDFFWDVCKAYPVSQFPIGPAGTWLSRLVGYGQNFVICTDIDELDSACNRRSSEFSRVEGDGAFLKVTLPRGMLSLPSGPDHKQHRRVFGPSMTSVYLSKVLPRIEQTFDELIELWRARMDIASRQGNTVIDISQTYDLRIAAVDTTVSLAFGTSMGGLRSLKASAGDEPSTPSTSASAPPSGLHESLFVMMEQMEKAFLQGPVAQFFTARSAKTRDTRKGLVRFAEERIALERSSGRVDQSEDSGLTDSRSGSSIADADCVLRMMLDGEAIDIAKGRAPLPHEDLVDGLLTFLIGGTDTTSVALAWTVKFLSRNGEVQSRLRRELAERLPAAFQPAHSGGLAFADLQDEARTPYLHAVVWECLRLARVGGMTMRTTTCDTTLSYRPIPKGTVVFFLIGHMGAFEHDGSNDVGHEEKGQHGVGGCKQVRWEAESVQHFRPERWLKRNENGCETFDRSAGPFAAFGSGPRGCFGKPLAILEMKVAIAKLVGTFVFEKVPDELDSNEYRIGFTRVPTQINLRIRSVDVHASVHARDSLGIRRS